MTVVEAPRPHEEEALFNPAFLAVLVREAAKAHEERAGSGPLPVLLAYLIAPLALHRPTRDSLPVNSRVQLGEWVREHPELLVGLDKHARALRPFVSDALRLGLRHGVISAQSGTLSAGVIRRRPRGMPRDADVDACFRSAAFLGRWFARQPDPLTTLALWGLRP